MLSSWLTEVGKRLGLVNGTPKVARKAARRRLCLEHLEDRLMPSTFVVNTTQDVLGHANGILSLRQAILDANSAPQSEAPHVIAFNLSANDANHFYYRNDGASNRLSLANKAATSAISDDLIANIDADWAHSWWTIKLNSVLPTITTPVVIDGYSQPGASANTIGNGDNAVPRIELNASAISFTQASTTYYPGSGTLAISPGPNQATLTLAAGSSGSTIAGLAINGFRDNRGIGIWLRSSSNHVWGNFIGTDISGTVAPNGLVSLTGATGAPYGYGIQVSDGGQFNVIGSNGDGANDPAERNVISANWWGVILRGYGIVSSPAQTSGYNAVAGNFIGTDRTGTVGLGNYCGVGMLGQAHHDRIGTTGTSVNPAGERNIISANGQGVSLAAGYYTAADGVYNESVAGNWIGLSSASGALGNVQVGVGAAIGAHDSTIGGSTPVLANTIAYTSGSKAPGVWIVNARANPYNIRVQGNSIHHNAGLGIDLGGSYPTPDGVTLNDSKGHNGGPSGTAPNYYQNFPVLTAAAASTSSTSVQGTLRSTPGATFTIDFYANTVADPTGYGEGETYLGSTKVTTDANGYATFTAGNLSALPAGQKLISATATDVFGNTSEFSRVVTSRQVTANAGGPYTTTFGGSVTLDASASSISDGSPLTYSWTINGHVGAASGINPTLTWSQLQALGVDSAQTYSVSVQITDTFGIVISSPDTSLLVNKAAPTVSVIANGGTYNGQAYAATGSAIGMDGVTPVAGTFTYTYYAGSEATTPMASAPVNAGSYTVVATFISADGNYTDGSATTTFTIAQAEPTVSVTAVYDRHVLTASGSAIGVDGITPVDGTFAYTYYSGSDATGLPLTDAPTRPGTYTVKVTFESADGNYTDGWATTTFTIGSANRRKDKVRGNNGLGNGLDPQPPGNPPVNDGPGTSPGTPGNRRGASGRQ